MINRTRPPSEILTDLARLSARRAELETELASALAAPPARPMAAPAEYVTTAMLGVSTRHLLRLRAAGKGPFPTRIGRAVRYRRVDVDAAGARAEVTAHPGWRASHVLAERREAR